MNQTITVPKNEFQDLVCTVRRIEQLLSVLLDEEEEARQHKATYQYEHGEPEYGSKEWWEWADKKGIEAARKGKSITFKTNRELIDYLDSLR